ncbi:nitroreductase [Paenibacillus sp. 598K]|uniref:nitroreductase family protein n=1 Tax=Paenibacillus sp. 598K TaxID=1117987 RepID=UPI000FF9891F|nr:nitroreductase family protein [Paenibacillus sp. 598K]GBF71878.1 nitroreductase [Paenibacillus sp. 598K]
MTSIPASALGQAIIGRRTVRQFDGRPVPIERILMMMEQAAWAPFHSAEEPWRFLLFTDDAKELLLRAFFSTKTPEFIDKYGANLHRMFVTDTPIHLMVVIPRGQSEMHWMEAHGAASAFIQNFQLLAWEQGIGVVWKTSAFLYEPDFCRRIGVQDDEYIVGYLQAGYYEAKAVPKAKARTAIKDRLTHHYTAERLDS